MSHVAPLFCAYLALALFAAFLLADGLLRGAILDRTGQRIRRDEQPVVFALDVVIYSLMLAFAAVALFHIVHAVH